MMTLAHSIRSRQLWQDRDQKSRQEKADLLEQQPDYRCSHVV